MQGVSERNRVASRAVGPRPVFRNLIVPAVVALSLIASCSGEEQKEASAPTAQPAEESAEDGRALGEGTLITMARGNWSTGYFQAEIYRAILTELGYEVSDPSQAEMSPEVYYPAVAAGDFDFWVNSWFPNQDRFFAAELADGSIVSDHVSKVGREMPAGVLQGYIVDRATARANGITTLADIGDHPDVAAIFDADGNGKADLLGCNDGWGCQAVINQTIARNGWNDTIEQISGDYSALWLDFLARAGREEPVLGYTWTPGPYTVQLAPGQDVIWLSVADPLPEQTGAVDLTPEECPGQPCEMGFIPADVLVTANNDFLEANPVAAVLLEQITLNPVDVSIQNLAMEEGENSQADIERHAREWIENNRAAVDRWLTAARAAG